MFHQKVSRIGLALIMLICTLLTGTVAAQAPAPDLPAHQPGGQPGSHPLAPGGPASAVPSAAVNAAPGDLGKPGLSFRYLDSMGELEVPYFADTAHLNRPISLYIDPVSNTLFVTEEQGFRALAYASDKTNLLALGRAGVSYTDNYVFGGARDVMVAPDGHVWVGDWARIVEYTASGDFIRNFPEEEPWNSGSDHGRFDDAHSIAFDGIGHMFVADGNNHRVEIFNWVSGSAPVYKTSIGFTDQPGSDLTHLNTPIRVRTRPDGTVYILDYGNDRVMRCLFNSLGDSWSCTEFFTGLSDPQGLALDASGAVYISDTRNGQIIKCMGSTCSMFYVDGWSYGVAVDNAGYIYSSEAYNCVVDKYSPSGTFIEHYLGVPGVCYLTDNHHFNFPRAKIDAQGNLLVLEESGHRLLKFSPNGSFLWSVGEAGRDGWENDHLNYPHGLDTDKNGNIYVADNWRVQIFNPNGVYQTTIGTPPDKANPTFSWVTDVAVNQENGNIYIADANNNRVAIYSSARVFIGQIGTTGQCLQTNLGLCSPLGVGLDATGNIYVADTGNNRVQKFNASRQYMMTLGITGEWSDQHNGFGNPENVVVDNAGRIYVGDIWNNRVQVFDATGAYLASIGGDWGAKNGQFRGAADVSVDSSGQVHVSDSGNARIQMFAQRYPGWLQTNINGFGYRGASSLTAVEVYNNHLYAASANWGNETDSGVWRSPDGKTWASITAPGQITGPDNKVIVDLQVFNGQLYASTGWTSDLSRLWRFDGAAWQMVLEQPVYSFATMTVFSGKLYMSELLNGDNPSFSIWRSASGNSGGSWSEMVIGSSSNTGFLGVLGFAEFHGRLYAAVINQEKGMEILRLANDQNSWEAVSTGGFGNPENWNTGGLTVFHDALYVSSENTTTGARIFSSANGDNWNLLNSDGFGDPNNTKIEGFTVLHDRLYAITYNSEQGMQVWGSDDGSAWERMANDGFGDVSNTGTLWNNGNVIFHDTLFIGTGNSAKGGQIWAMLPTYLFLPVTRR